MANEHRSLMHRPLTRRSPGPTSNAAVTISIAATTDCSADSAICTTGGKMLSSVAVVTIARP